VLPAPTLAVALRCQERGSNISQAGLLLLYRRFTPIRSGLGRTMLSLRLLGGTSLSGNGNTLAGPATQRHRLALLALLASSRGRPQSRDKLVTWLWPERDVEHARNLLNQSVHALRRAIGEAGILSVQDELRLDPAAVACDVVAFEDAIAAGELERAVGLYTGPFLDGFHLPGASEFEHWADGERERLRRSYACSLERLAEAAEGREEWSSAVERWRGLVSEERYNARVTLRLMRALERAGDRAGALQQARLHALLLQQEFESGPDPDVVALADRLRTEPANGDDARVHTGAWATARVTTDLVASSADLIPPLDAPPSASPSPGPPQPRALRRGRSVLRGLPVLGLGILIGLGVLFAWTRARSSEAAGEAGLRRVAVLPFENLGEPDQAYFADGITDEIRGKLATISGLQVTARTSSARYAQGTKPAREIGRELGVDYLLTGTVRWNPEGSRSRVRVSPELVQAASGASRWQQSFDAPLTDIFQVQANIAERVARELGVALAAGQQRHMEERVTGELGAYDLYLRGRYAWHQRPTTSLDQARQLLERALALDPEFALAHAALADVYTVLPLWSDIPPDQTYPRAKAAALAALKLDSTLAAPYAVLGSINAMYEWDWVAADRNFRRSLTLDPNHANTRNWYNTDYLVPVGRLSEAVAEARRARELDPLSVLINGVYGHTLYRAGRLKEAEAHLRGVRALDGRFTSALASLYLIQGRAADAVPLVERPADPTVRGSYDLALLGYGYAKAGRHKEAEALLRELLERRSKGYVSPTTIALLSAGLGDTTATFVWLRRAVEIHDPKLVYQFVNEPLLEPFRRDPRGMAILRAMRLPETR
jgi:DNA-binding SARP family transcriptional activator/TolB-like protein/Tfp pilus assembly protein PilF